VFCREYPARSRSQNRSDRGGRRNGDAKGRPRNDFTEWLMGYGEEHQELAMRIAGIDPYFTTLSELRNELHQVFSVYLRERRGRS